MTYINVSHLVRLRSVDGCMKVGRRALSTLHDSSFKTTYSWLLKALSTTYCWSLKTFSDI